MAREMSFEQLEQAYETLADAIDSAGPRNEALFLTKLVILLAQKSGDLAAFTEALEIAKQNLPPE